MGKLLSDHQESNSFAYNRTWGDMEKMLDDAERVKNHHLVGMNETPTKSKKWIYHARNFKAMEGVVKTLKWCLGDKNIAHPLD
tara:strand:+ start:2592 stop:2840 length:249 start_codon:yes stop_codon:yes gene_type:complete